MQIIGREIRLAKQNAKLTTREISQAVGINSHTLNAILQGKNANFENYLKVLHLFGAEIEVKMPYITSRLKGKVKSVILEKQAHKEGNALNTSD